MTINTCKSSLILGFSLALSACGGGGGGSTAISGGGNTNSGNLANIVSLKMEEVPVIISELKNQNGSAMTGSDVLLSFEKNYLGLTDRFTASFNQTDSDGIATNAASPGTYYLTINSNQPTTGDFVGTYTVSSSETQSMVKQTSEQQFTITANQGSTELAFVDVKVYQVDSQGNIIDSTSPSLSIQDFPNDSSVSISTELFQGQYRYVVSGQASDDDNDGEPDTSLASVISDVVNIGGNGATEVVQEVDLSSAGNVISLSFKDTAGNNYPQTLYACAFNKSDNLPIGLDESDSDSVISLQLDEAFTNIYILYTSTPVSDCSSNTQWLGVYRNSSVTGTISKELRQVDITGAIQPTSGSLDSNDSANVQVSYQEDDLNFTIANAAIQTNGTGAYTTEIFPGTYVFEAVSVAGFPTTEELTVNVTESQTVNIDVSRGGVIKGRIQDEANNNLANITVDALAQGSYDAELGETVFLAQAVSDSSGIYEIEVPYGTYDIMVRGAITENLTVSASSPTKTLNLRRFQITGRVVEAETLGSIEDVSVSAFLGDSTQTSNVGVYTIDLYEGENDICFGAPSDRTTLGTKCFFSVPVNESIVESIKN